MRKLLYYILLLFILSVPSYSWDSLNHPGTTPRNLYVVSPGENLLVGTFWTGFFLFNLESSAWVLPEYGPECCNGGLTTLCIDSPRLGSDTLLATSSEVYGYYNNPPYIIRSNDGGETWIKSDYGLLPPSSGSSYFVAFDPFHPDTVLWGGGHRHLYKSIDCGYNWDQMSTEIRTTATSLTWSKNQEGLLLLGTAIISDTTGLSGILRSEDYGESFEQVWPTSFPEQGRALKINKIVEDPFNPNHWLAAVYDYYTTSENHGDCLLTSNDMGRTWTLSMEGLDNVFNIEDLLADPNQSGRFWATAPQEGIFRTDNGGLTWVHDDEGLGQYDNYKYLAIDHSTNTLFVSQYKGLVYHKLISEQTWQPLASNPYDNSNPSLSMNNNTIVTTNSMGVFASSLPPNWNIHRLDDNLYEDLGVEDHLYIAIDQEDTNRRAIASITDWRNFKYRIHVSENDGNNWVEWADNSVLEDCPAYIEFIHPDTLIAVGILSGSVQLVWEDGHQIIAGPNLGYISDFQRDGNNCLFSINGIVFWSDNRGITRYQANGEQNGNPINYFDGSTSENGFLIGAGSHENIYYSCDGGHNWSQIESPCQGTFGQVAMGGDFMYVIARRDNIVYAREGLDGHWFALDENWPIGFYPLEIVADEDGIVMSGNVDRPDVQRLFYMPTPQSGVSSGWEALPTSYMLHPPYPNPFNAETTISFTLPEPSQVKITISNLNGQQVALLADQYYTFGKHSVHWNASDFASATYIITMKTANGKKLARKVQLIK